MIRVLIVEDEPIVAKAHARYLERLSGFAVAGIADDGRAALRLLGLPDKGQGGSQAQTVDVLLLDMNLPDLHGLELVRQLRTAGHPVDIIAITAARELVTVRNAIAAGVVQYLIKPFAFSVFAEKLEEYRAYRNHHSRAAEALEASAVDQKTVDLALASLQGRTVPQQPAEPHLPALPKGLSEQTLRSVIRWLRSASAPVSAQEVTDALGISRVTARRYLEYLADHGPVRRSPRYGGPGRPEHEYSWTATQRGARPSADQA